MTDIPGPARAPRRLLAAALLTLACISSHAQEQAVAFVNARLLTIARGEVVNGALVVQGGRILGVGPVRSVEIPGDAIVVNAAGKTIMPGLVDTHSHLGGVGAADGTGPFQPGVRVADSLNVRSSGFRRAVAGGLTTLNIMPGSGHLSSGQTIYVKLRWFDERPPESIDDIWIRDGDGGRMGGLKMANGTNPIREGGAGGWPGTRGRAAFLVREQFIRAREYAARVEAARREDGTTDPDKLPARDLHLETLVECMNGTRIVHHHTHRHDDIMTVLRLADEFRFRVVLHHVSEAWFVADQIAAYRGVDGPDGTPWGAPCSAILVDSPGGKLEAVNLVMEMPGRLEKAGARVALHTDDWITDSRLFLRMAALAVRAGMSREAALRSLTIEGARMLDLADRVGTLEPGKDADFIILSGDPLSVYTVVEQTWVEGRRVFDRSNPDSLLHAQGGFGASEDIEPYFCCYHEQMTSGTGGATR